MKKISQILITILFFVACSNNDAKDDLVNQVEKNGAIETSIKVAHLNDSTDILTTKHIIWLKDTSYKTITKNDTIPKLGDTTFLSENNVSNKVRKDYNIFITIK